MSSTILKPEQPVYQAKGDDLSSLSLQEETHNPNDIVKPFSKESLKHIIHDLNHHLMLIGLSADNLAGYSAQNNIACENARILRRNLDQVSTILAALFADNDVAADNGQIDWAQLDLLIQRQRFDWQLLLGEAHDLTILVEPFSGTLYLEPLALMRVLTNFVHNALDALNEKRQIDPHFKAGAISIIIEPSSEEAGEKALFIHIKDNGAGVKEALKGRLFEAGQSSKKEQGKPHRGFGLSSAHELLARWEGKAALLSSSAETGSHFVLTLPLYD